MVHEAQRPDAAKTTSAALSISRQTTNSPAVWVGRSRPSCAVGQTFPRCQWPLLKRFVCPIVLGISAFMCCHRCEQWSLTDSCGKSHLLGVMRAHTALVTEAPRTKIRLHEEATPGRRAEVRGGGHYSCPAASHSVFLSSPMCHSSLKVAKRGSTLVPCLVIVFQA